MKTFTISDIRSWKPCYDPSRHLPEDWQGTALGILRQDKIPPQDKLWVVCRKELIDAKTLRLFAVWCARQVQHLMKDERSNASLDVAERFANGTATKEELAAAWDAARDAAAAAAMAAAGDAWDAARDAAAAAAMAAAGDAWDAARAAAGDAARAAAGDAWDAAGGAWDAWDAARDAAWAAQVSKLTEMLEDSDV